MEPARDAVTVYVVRHGETLANRGGVFQGQMDVPLSEMGRRQAEAVGGALAGVQFDVVYSSDLSRAAETARAIMKHQKCRLVLDRRLREMNGGLCQGTTHEETLAAFPEFVRAWEEDPWNTRRPGGESFADLKARVGRAMDDIVAWNSGKPGGSTVALVGHGGVIRAVLTVAGVERPLLEASVRNCSISIVRRSGNEWTAVKVDECAHLDGISGGGD